MAIKLEDKPNVVAPGGAYPYGDIRDKTASVPGTRVNRLVYADFHQFFARMLDISGVVANGLPDNLTNTFQYFLALQEVIKQEQLVQNAEQTNFFSICNALFNTFGYSGVAMIHPPEEVMGGLDNGTVPPRYNKNRQGQVNITGCFNAITGTFDTVYGNPIGVWFLIFTLPVGYRPRRDIVTYMNDGVWIKISPDGSFKLWTDAGGDFSVNFDAIKPFFAFQ